MRAVPRISVYGGKMSKRVKATVTVARLAAEAALYFVLTFFMQPIAFSPVLQFRVGEALTLLPIIFPEAVFGVTLGCLLANLFSPYAWYDIVFGTLATLIAAALTYLIGRWMKNKRLIWRALAGSLPPIFVNAVILPLMWLLAMGDAAYWLNLGMLIVTQAGAVVCIGVPLVLALDKTNSAIRSRLERAEGKTSDPAEKTEKNRDEERPREKRDKD